MNSEPCLGPGHPSPGGVPYGVLKYRINASSTCVAALGQNKMAKPKTLGKEHLTIGDVIYKIRDHAVIKAIPFLPFQPTDLEDRCPIIPV